MSLKALFETIDFCTRMATVKTAEAIVKIPLIRPALPDDAGRLPDSDEIRYRTYARIWCRDGIAYYREIWE